MVSRRAILITGGAGICLFGAGLGGLLHSDLTSARAPWRAAGTGFGEARLDALSWAVTAPSPHNRQPWLIRLDGDGGLTVFCDLTRLLRVTDPEDRQIVIGLGAFLEVLRIAAAEQGFRLDTEFFPEGAAAPLLDARPAARIRFVPDTEQAKDPLFAAIPDRRTSRAIFDRKRPVTAEALNALDASLRPGDGEFEWANDAGNIAALKDISRQAWRIEMEKPEAVDESAQLTRIGEKEVNANPDGISLIGPAMEAGRLAGMLTREAMVDPNAKAWQATLDYYNARIDSAMAFGWLSTAGNSREDQLRAGAGWVRLQLAAAARGLSMHPLSQALQEYPEMAAVFDEMHAFAGVRAPGRVQGLFRFGYGPRVPPAPRWPLQTRLIEG